MTDEEKKAWSWKDTWGVIIHRINNGHRILKADYPAILAADAELIALLSRVAVLEKENKILETIARGCLGTQFAETYLTELRRREKEARLEKVAEAAEFRRKK